MNNAYILAAYRTPVCRAYKGKFRTVRPDDLAAAAIKGLVERTDIEPLDVEDVILGCAFPEGEQGMNMARLTGDGRRAFFVCCMVLILDEYRIFSAQETFGGFIADEPFGSGGFGYDPIFHLPGRDCTVAELDAVEKDRISHRGRAGLRIKAILDNLDASP